MRCINCEFYDYYLVTRNGKSTRMFDSCKLLYWDSYTYEEPPEKCNKCKDFEEIKDVKDE